MEARRTQDPMGGAHNEEAAMASALSRVRKNGHHLLVADGDPTTWRLSSRIQLQETPEATTGIVIDTHSARICRCNGTAWSMLRVLEQGANLEQLVDAVCAEYRVAAENAQDDALEFIARLRRVEFVDEG